MVDRVKLGRALGYGTRHAAKTLAAVAEAATAPDPGPTAAGRQGPEARRDENAPQRRGAAAEAPRRSQASVPRAAHVRRAGGSFLAPLATFSSALWLRVTGVFFAIVALTMAGGVWRLRGVVRAGADLEAMRHFWLFVGFAVLFGYFAVSSFVRANLRERRAAARTGR